MQGLLHEQQMWLNVSLKNENVDSDVTETTVQRKVSHLEVGLQTGIQFFDCPKVSIDLQTFLFDDG